MLHRYSGEEELNHRLSDYRRLQSDALPTELSPGCCDLNLSAFFLLTVDLYDFAHEPFMSLENVN
jgi:hypothetical protein